MLIVALDSAGLILLTFLAAYVVVLVRRIGRLRTALAEAGQVLPSLDAAVTRMDEAARGFSARLKGEMEQIEQRLCGLKRVATELSGATRTAEDVLSALDRQMRQAKKLEGARAAAIPRELAEPKGLVERTGSEPTAPALAFCPAPAPLVTPALEPVAVARIKPAAATDGSLPSASSSAKAEDPRLALASRSESHGWSAFADPDEDGSEPKTPGVRSLEPAEAGRVRVSMI
jgi:hypothetical protein